MGKVAVFVLALAGLAYATSEAWKTKPYEQWNAADLKEVLWNSPWVKSASVPVEWQRVSVPLNAGKLQGNQPGVSRGSVGGGPGNGPYGNAGNSEAAPPVASGNQDATINVPYATFYVRWNSAQTVREALAQQAVLGGQLSQAESTQFLAEPQSAYVIQVSGSDMTPFAGQTEDSLKADTYIEVKPSRMKISPSSVQITNGPNGSSVQFLLFSFPKQEPNGAASIDSAAKQAHFHCKLKNLQLDLAFDLRKMAGKQGRDL